jgi:hypothetical protein
MALVLRILLTSQAEKFKTRSVILRLDHQGDGQRRTVGDIPSQPVTVVARVISSNGSRLLTDGGFDTKFNRLLQHRCIDKYRERSSYHDDGT